MTLTSQIIHEAGTNYAGFNYHQLKVLGQPIPPKRHWLKKLVGKYVDDETWGLVLALKNTRKRDRDLIIERYRNDRSTVNDLFELALKKDH